MDLYILYLAILTDAGLHQSFRMIDTQDSLKFEPWKLVYVYIYIYNFILRWNMVDTFGETREHETKTQKGVAVSFSEGERRGGVGRGYIWYLCGLFLSVLLHLHVHSNTTLQLFIRYYVQNTPSFQIIYIRMQNYVFCPFVALCTTKLKQKDWNSLTFSLGGEGNFLIFFPLF